MPKVSFEAHDAIAVLRLNNGVTNAISPELVDDLAARLKRIKSEFKGLVLAGGDKFFCIGLDLPGLLQLSRSEMIKFYVTFNQAVLDLYTLPMPTACAIAGHATAGGAVLALSTDFRFLAAGRKFIGFNEVKIGLPVPGLADLILRQLVGDRRTTEMMLNGEFLEPEPAHKIGLVDAVFSAENVEKEAVAKILALTVLPPGGLVTIKKNRVAAVRSQYTKIREAETDGFLNCWFNPSVQVQLREACKKF
jgi:enoyl-CoA hydratase/carnithine racemase